MCGSLFLYSCSEGISAVIGQQIRIICTDKICNCVTNSVMELVMRRLQSILYRIKI